MSFSEDLDDKIVFFLINNKKPRVIYVTMEEYSQLARESDDRKWDASPISKSDQAALAGIGYKTIEAQFHGVPVKVLARGSEIRMASLLSKEQLAIFLIDPNEEMRSIAYQALLLMHPDWF